MLEEGNTEIAEKQQEEKDEEKIFSKINDLINIIENPQDCGLEIRFRCLEEVYGLMQVVQRPAELKETIGSMYDYFAESEEFDDGSKVSFPEKTIKNFFRIYEITGIVPDVSSDITNTRELRYYLQNPEIFLFLRHKDDPDTLKEIIKDTENNTTVSLVRRAIEEKYSVSDLVRICDQIFGESTENIYTRLFAIKRLEENFPEITYRPSKERVNSVLLEVIDGYVNVYSSGGYFNDKNGDDAFLIRMLEKISEFTGISLNEIIFNESQVRNWYSIIIPRWIDVARRSLMASTMLSTIVTIERITGVHPDFSTYAHGIREIFKSEIVNLGEYAPYTGQRSDSILYTEIKDDWEKITKVTGVSPADEDIQILKTLVQEELNRQVIDNESSVQKSFAIYQTEKKFDIQADMSDKDTQRIYEKHKIFFDRTCLTDKSEIFNLYKKYGSGEQRGYIDLYAVDEAYTKIFTTAFAEFANEDEREIQHYTDSELATIKKILSKSDRECIKLIGSQIVKSIFEIESFNEDSILKIEKILEKMIEMTDQNFLNALTEQVEQKIREWLIQGLSSKITITDHTKKCIETFKKIFGIQNEKFTDKNNEDYIGDRIFDGVIACGIEYVKTVMETAGITPKTFFEDSEHIARMALKMVEGVLSGKAVDWSIKEKINIPDEVFHTEKIHQKFTETLWINPTYAIELLIKLPFLLNENTIKKIDEQIGKIIITNPRLIIMAISETDRKDILDHFLKNPWIHALMRIKKIQEINQNEENDPWKKELQPFLADIFSKGDISMENSDDTELLVGFIKKYGMLNLPVVFRVYSVCSRARSWDDIPEEVIVLFESCGVKVRAQNAEKSWRFPSPKSLLSELEKIVRGFQTELLADQIPASIFSEIGKEQFQRLTGNTRWKRGDSVDILLTQWQQTVEEQPEIAILPRGYTEEHFQVREVRSENSTPKRNEDTLTELEKMWASAEVGEQYTPLAEAIHHTFHVDDAYWEQRREELMSSLKESIEIFSHEFEMSQEEWQQAIMSEPSEQKKSILAKKQKALASERGRAGMQKQIEGLRNMYESAVRLSEIWSANIDVEDTYVKTMEILSQITDPKAFKMLREMSMAHILKIAPEGWRDSLLQHFGGDSRVTETRVAELARFSREYLSEHYLAKKQDPAHTGHTPFSSGLVFALERAWQQQESSKGEKPIEKLAQKIKHIVNPTIEKTDKMIGVAMVPVAGPLRIYSGDIGDACYTSQHMVLAKGECVRLHSWIYVTGRSTNQETLQGSLLGVQTTDELGISTLVARANNPQENFIQGLDGDEFVVESLKKVIDTARRLSNERVKNGRGDKKQRVVIPMDPSTTSSTNRPAVSSSYHNRWKTCSRIGLTYEPETNFNGYPIWNKNGGNPCVIIWEMDEQGQETWYGDWKPKT